VYRQGKIGALSAAFASVVFDSTVGSELAGPLIRWRGASPRVVNTSAASLRMSLSCDGAGRMRYFPCRSEQFNADFQAYGDVIQLAAGLRAMPAKTNRTMAGSRSLME
jgi:hypothetical protein